MPPESLPDNFFLMVWNSPIEIAPDSLFENPFRSLRIGHFRDTTGFRTRYDNSDWVSPFLLSYVFLPRILIGAFT